MHHEKKDETIQSQHLLSLLAELIIVHNVAGTRPSKTHCISIASDSAGIKYENNLWINHYISTQLTLGRFMKIIFFKLTVSQPSPLLEHRKSIGPKW
jgi:hypothetical protein